MDIVEKSEAEFRHEFSELLKGCTNEELDILYSSCKALLDVFRKKR